MLGLDDSASGFCRARFQDCFGGFLELVVCVLQEPAREVKGKSVSCVKGKFIVLTELG